jgi:hypothetical protein
MSEGASLATPGNRLTGTRGVEPIDQQASLHHGTVPGRRKRRTLRPVGNLFPCTVSRIAYSAFRAPYPSRK